MTWRQYGEGVRAAALGLMDLGLQPGQVVAFLSGTREEYNVADLGVTHAGGITVTLYQTLAPAQVVYIVDHSEAVLAFVESAAQAEKFVRIRGEIPRVRKLILFEGAEAFQGEPWVLGFDALLARAAVDHQRPLDDDRDRHDRKSRHEQSGAYRRLDLRSRRRQKQRQ